MAAVVEKRILLNEDLEVWTNSEIYASLLDFVESLQNSVVGSPNDEKLTPSANVDKIMDCLARVSTIADENAVVHEKDISRFGKIEFRDFYDQVKQEAPLMAKLLVSSENEQYADELASYFAESWGDRQRIDYGSGHEFNFLCFLFCLDKLHSVGTPDYKPLVLKVFNRYMEVMRKLQKTYWLEPAGSHGVWGLDDYHFLPFLFGSAQLATHRHMKPKLIHNKELVETYWKQYMYLECIHFINSIKTVPGNQNEVSLRWHSPMLDDILSAKSWAKIKEGMIKMYKAEVLGKLPIMQHVMFGSLIPVPEGIPRHSEAETDECGHVHSKDTINTWGDCCGIKVPSAIAASQSLESSGKSRPLPFD